MGLDTVELLVAFEQYFSLTVPDAVAERFYTVADVADYISQQLGVAGRQSAARQTVARQLLSELPPGTEEATPLTPLLPDVQTLKNVRYTLRDRYGLVLPELAAPPTWPRASSLWERLTGAQLLLPPHWRTQTLAELIDWVVAYNYEKVLGQPLASQYEVERAVIGLTSDRSGVPVEEIQLRHSFTNDLGMD